MGVYYFTLPDILLNFIAGSTAVVAPNYFHPEFIYSQYNAVVNENATLGSTILTIASTDNDTGAAGAIHYERLQGPGNDYFTINGQTGEITNVKSLNTTTTPKVFFLTVTARDYGTPIKYTLSHANITIAVLSPSLPDNTIVAVGATTMSIELSKEPFDDPKVLSYQVVGQEYDPNVSNCKYSVFLLASPCFNKTIAKVETALVKAQKRRDVKTFAIIT